jgi:hypothetical protein
VTGPTSAAIVIPIVAFILLAAWLTMVFWADSHPRFPSSPSSRQKRDIPGAEPEDTRPRHVPQPRSASDVPAGASSPTARPDEPAEQESGRAAHRGLVFLAPSRPRALATSRPRGTPRAAGTRPDTALRGSVQVMLRQSSGEN